MKHHARWFFGLIAILYPLLVFCALVVFNLPNRYLSIGIMVFALAYSAFNIRQQKGKHRAALFVSPAVLCIIGAVSLFLNSALVLKLYPALADLAYITIFTTSLFVPPPLARYFIELFDKTIPAKLPQQEFERYCFRATVVWCGFFLIDGIIALGTVFWGTDIIWGIYNSGITYGIMGLIFAGEYIILKITVKRCAAQTRGGGKTHVNS
jgi:uncharacterized membrane protein